jgi:hypothetical protein
MIGADRLRPADPALAVGPERIDLARAFFANPWGPHGVELQSLLNRMRAAPVAGKLVLFCTKPYQEWRLARLPQRRGLAPEILEGPAFSSLADAERAAFRIRWQELTGAALPDP